MKKILLSISLIIVLGVAGVLASQTNQEPQEVLEVANNTDQVVNPLFAEASAVVYKSPTCGCCEGHANAMKDAGIAVEIVELPDLVSLKDEHAIPVEMQSCHTTLLTSGEKEYVVEGHVPLEGIEKLLTEQPDIRGIALPGMPIGTPGMPGQKTEAYNIQTLEDDSKLFLAI